MQAAAPAAPMAALIEKPRAKPMFKPGTVHWAAEMADTAALDKLILQAKAEKGWPESVTLQEKEDMLGMMPIHIASEHGHLECVQYLIRKRVDLDAGDKFRVTALHLAAIHDHGDVVETLLAAKANPRYPDVDGDLAIHWAATKGHSNMAGLLVKAGSPVDPVNKIQWTPLHRAAYNGRRACCQALVNLGASLSAKNKDGNTPLHLAAFMNQLSTIETLLGLAARTDTPNDRGQLPLDMCITDAARELLEIHGASSRYAADTPPASRGSDKPATPAATPLVPAPTELSEALQGLKTRPSDTALNAALRNRVKAAETFPEDKATAPAAAAAAAEESTLLMRPSGGLSGRLSASASEFLHEASQAFDDRANPYMRGYARGGEGERSSRSSIASERTSAAQTPQQLQRRVSDNRTSAAGHHQRAPVSSCGGTLQARLSVTTTDRRVSLAESWHGVERESAGDFQERIREANRRAAATSAAGNLLAPPGGALAPPPAAGAPAGTTTKRPNSGNKKFLEGYGLNKYNLFAPS